MLPTAVVSKSIIPFLTVARLYINQVKIIKSEIRKREFGIRNTIKKLNRQLEKAADFFWQYH